MTVKIGSVASWKQIEDQKALVFEGGPTPRKIRLEVLTGAPTRFFIERENGSGFPLGQVDGLDVIEFVEGGNVKVIATAGPGVTLDAWFRTAEGVPTSTALPHATTFTKIATRRARNRELELMQFMAEVNLQRRLDRHLAEIDRRNARLEQAKQAGIDPETGEVLDDDGNGKKRAGAGARNSKGAKARAKHDAGPAEPDEGAGDGKDPRDGDAETGNGFGERSKVDTKQGVPEDD